MSCQTSAVPIINTNWKRAVNVPPCIFVPNWPHLGFLLSGSECGVGSWWAASGKPWCRVAAPLAHSWPLGWASGANQGSGCPQHPPPPIIPSPCTIIKQVWVFWVSVRSIFSLSLLPSLVRDLWRWANEVWCRFTRPFSVNPRLEGLPWRCSG